jgi:shikimate dehydrogenase
MTQRVGIIGWPLTFTLSPAMHNAAFKALGMDWQYDIMAIPPDIVRYGLREPAQHGYIGVNVTIPHKEAVLRYVEPDATARAIGAVNTVDLRTDAGYNTDVTGFTGDLKAHGVALKSARVIVLGAGGAARAAVYGLGLEGAAMTVINRTPARALKMIADLSLYQPTLNARAATLAEAVESGVDLIVNCTSVGMIPDVNANPWDASVPFPRGATVYDMVYRPSVTALMRQAEAHGGRAIAGLGMLVRQGAEAFRIWTGVDAPLDIMEAAARQALADAEAQ